jgi:hypothetical protein
MQKEPEISDMGVAVNRGKTTLCAKVFAHLRPWHIGCILSLVGMSCVLPEPLDAVDDVKVNYPPSIVSTDPASTGGTVVIPSDPLMPREFSLTPQDLNVDDTLHVRFFIDYSFTTTPAGPVAIIDIPPGTMAQRSPVTASIGCGVSRVPIDGMKHFVTAVVSDRPFVDSMPPLFRAVPADTVAAEVSWTVQCGP